MRLVDLVTWVNKQMMSQKLPRLWYLQHVFKISIYVEKENTKYW